MRGSNGKKAGRSKGQQGVTRSFSHAYDGLVEALRTQRNLRIHVALAAVVLIVSLLARVSHLQLAVLVLVIVAVIVTEMLNTALEFSIDLFTTEYHPLAKLAKDISAGAVLVVSLGAVVVGGLILGPELMDFVFGGLRIAEGWPGQAAFVAVGLAALAALAGTALLRSGRAPSGITAAAPSGGAAVAFAAWISASYIAFRVTGGYAGVISALVLLMALLVCQSRVEAGGATVSQAISGAVAGAVAAAAVFQLF